MIADLANLPLHRHDPALLMPRIWSLYHAVSPYDAAHVTLAEALGAPAPLLTRDARLARAPGHGAAVRVLD